MASLPPQRIFGRPERCSPALTRTTLPPRALLLLVVLTLVWGTNWPLFPLAVREVLLMKLVPASSSDSSRVWQE